MKLADSIHWGVYLTESLLWYNRRWEESRETVIHMWPEDRVFEVCLDPIFFALSFHACGSRRM